MPGVLALRLPEGYKPEPFAPPSPAPSIGTALYPSAGALGALHQLRHGYGLGKLAGDVLEQVVECPGASRRELAARLGPGRKPETLKRPLQQLREAGLVENRVRGRYWAVEDWQHALDRVRTMSGEKLAENLAQQRDEREREAYRRHLVEKEAARDDPAELDSTPSSAVKRKLLVNFALWPKRSGPVDSPVGSLSENTVRPRFVTLPSRSFGGSGDAGVDSFSQGELAIDVAALPQEKAVTIHRARARQRRLVASTRARVELELGRGQDVESPGHEHLRLVRHSELAVADEPGAGGDLARRPPHLQHAT